MTAGRRGKRPRHEDAALAALLAEPTIAQAAEKAGIGESTLLRWLADPAFKARYRDARRQIVEHAVARLQQTTSEAVGALRRNLACGNPSVEVGAARVVFDQALRAIELADLAERVEQLEQSAAQDKREGEDGKR